MFILLETFAAGHLSTGMCRRGLEQKRRRIVAHVSQVDAGTKVPFTYPIEGGYIQIPWPYAVL